jgi:hypothetical protein
MAVTMSKPPKKTTVKRTFTLKAFHWRSSEERREAKRKINAIRREADAAHMALIRPVNAKALRNPRLLFGLFALLIFSGAIVVNILFRSPATQAVKAESVQGMRNRALKNVKVLAVATTMFRIDTKMWPRYTEQHPYGVWETRMDYGAPGWRGPYVKWISNDPWDNPYVYVPSNSPFIAPTILSCGPDGKPHTEDDITSLPEDFTCDKGQWQAPTTPTSEATHDQEGSL